jgi:hypothetical protein
MLHIKVMRIYDHCWTDSLRLHMSLYAYIVSVLSPPWFHSKPLKILNLTSIGDLDPAFHSIMDRIRIRNPKIMLSGYGSEYMIVKQQIKKKETKNLCLKKNLMLLL